ncbi:hypothetical protein OG618_00305 [Kitasatospora sp. NBC_01246]|uniref:hypothetical protein n=1 Tax=Kitasatospora sp. NBC_01246 TaxID=2903570 RepID=UPI002E2F8C6C|nr:hypothetical protein [Kitasatospora sp. NBC_01246]
MLESRFRKTILAGSASILMAYVVSSSLPAAQATTGVTVTPSAVGSTTNETIPLAIEDFQHPGAARILTERKVTLKQGDGRIRLKEGVENNTQAACQGANDIFVESRIDDKNGYCFTVSGTTGYLAMELPSVYGFWTEERSVSAKLVASGHETLVNVAPNSAQPVGESVPGGQRSVLVELRVTS